MIGSLARWLDTTLTLTTREMLEASLHKVVEDWPLDQLIDAYIQDARELTKLAARSYRHPNGFDRIELITAQTGRYSLRLHAWWGSESIRQENIHSHPWCFASFILSGRLWFEQYVEVAEGERLPVSLYGPPSGETYNFTPAGTAALQLVLRGAMQAGSSYSAHSSLIHRVWTDPCCDTLTLMLHGDGLAYPSRVFSSLENSHGVFRRDRPSAESLRATLQRIKRLLTRSESTGVYISS